MPPDTKQVLRDQAGLPVPQYFNNDSDAFEALYGSEGGAQVSSLQRKFRSDFLGAALNTEKWTLVQQGPGQTITHNATNMVVGMGTTTNSETIIESVEMFSPSMRMMFSLFMSQRIANNQVFIELVSVDANGAVEVAQVDRAAWLFESTVATNVKTEVQAGGTAATTINRTTLTSAAASIYEIEVYPDECWFHQKAIDSTAGRSYSYVHNRAMPDPNKKYRIRLRFKNGAVAPATSTNVTMEFVTLVDYTELTTEVTASRGAAAGGMALPVAITSSVYGNGVSGVLSVISGANFIGAPDSTTNLAAGATFTGAGRDGNSYTRFRAIVAHTAGLTPGHLVIQQSTDNATYRETHRIPIPSDGQYRTFDFSLVLRYCRVLFVNGGTAQTFMYLATRLVGPESPIQDPDVLPFIETAANLAAAATFTGTTMNFGPKGHYRQQRAIANADQAGTIYLEQSRDGTNWWVVKSAALVAGTPTYVEAPILMQYARTRYVNGATAQTAFALVTSLGA